jgi:hypothetical protein
MKKDVPIDRLHSQRAYDGQVDDLVESIQAEGLKHPIVVTTEYEVVDGLRRIDAATKLGFTHIPAVVTNDYPTMLAQLKLANADTPPTNTRAFYDLYEQVKPFGVAWRAKLLSEVRTGKKVNSTGPTERQQRLGYRQRFLEVFGLLEWRLAEYQEVLSTADRVRAKSSAHAAAADEIVIAAGGADSKTTGCRSVLYALEQISSTDEVERLMDHWRKRRQNQAPRSGPPFWPKREARRKPKVPAYDKRLAAAHDAIATLEGIAMGLPHIDIPADVDPDARKALVLRATDARRLIGHFLNRLKGSEDQ